MNVLVENKFQRDFVLRLDQEGNDFGCRSRTDGLLTLEESTRAFWESHEPETVWRVEGWDHERVVGERRLIRLGDVWVLCQG